MEDDSHFLFRQKLLGEDGSVRRGTIMVKPSGVFSPKFGATSSHVFTQSPYIVAVETGIHSFAYLDPVLRAATTDMIYIYLFNRSWFDTRWQQYSSHLHTNNTHNTENGTYITI
jgi:hypothetical protein